jgi:predicted transcriptional regulator
VAVTMIAIGLLWNVWFVLIGFFVYFGASAEEAATLVHARLVGRRVGEVMMLEPVVVFPDTSVEQLRILIRHSTQRAFPVVMDGEYRGMIDVTAIERGAPDQTAADIADHATPAADVGDGVEDDLPRVLSAPARALAVVDGGAVAGLLRIEDVQHLVDADDVTD